ncbi:MAG: peptide deformylase [Pseudomonadota bacterium]
MIHPILRHPHPVLTAKAQPVEHITDAIRTFAADMLETMYAAPGRGLAAPQIGLSLRLFVMDPGWKEGTPAPLIAINPVITPLGEGTATGDEGCLSIPGITTAITRPAHVRLDYTDTEGRAQSVELTGFAAACAQHEADHLDGVLTLDRLDAAARAQAEEDYAAL